MPRADRRDQLVATAEQVFLTSGVAAASMDEVAERAGVTKPVLYDHFGSKDGLLAAVVTRSGERLLAVIAEAFAGTTDAELALRQGLTAYFRFVDANEGAWSLLLQEVTPGSAAAVAADAIRTAQVEGMADLVAEHLQRDRASALVYAHLVSGAAERLAAVRLARRRLSAARATELVMDVIWTGFAGLREKEKA